MEHNAGDGRPSQNRDGRGGRAPKIISAAAAALMIAFVALASGYLGVKLAGGPAVKGAAGFIPNPAQASESVPPVNTAGVVVVFTDKVVEQVIRTTLNKSGGDVTVGDMEQVTSFIYDFTGDKNATGTITTLSDLRHCTNLETLRVVHQQVGSLEGLRNLDKLSDISIPDCTVFDLSPLAGKASLRKVLISGNPVTDASPVLSLPNLEEFDALSGTFITDISALSDSGNLTNFYCSNTLDDYTPLLRQKNLRGVTLSGISDWFFRELLANCRILRNIRLDHSQIESGSLSLLKGYTVYSLHLEHCGLKDISALADLANVVDLGLGGNQIEDITALKELSHIRGWLDLRDNKITDLRPLALMTTLESLTVTGNPCTNDTVLDELEKGGCKVYR